MEKQPDQALEQDQTEETDDERKTRIHKEWMYLMNENPSFEE